MYKLVITPDPVLSKIAQSVASFDKDLLNVLKEMEETLRATDDPKGVGLAAPQVGLSLRIFQMKPKDESPVTSYINPEIIEISAGSEISVHPNSQKIEKM